MSFLQKKLFSFFIKDKVAQELKFDKFNIFIELNSVVIDYRGACFIGDSSMIWRPIVIITDFNKI